MAEVHRIEEGIDHIVVELMCVNCHKRHLSLHTLRSWLKDLECPYCKQTGYLINTGEVIGNYQYEKVCEQNPELEIYRQYIRIYQEEE